MKAILFSLFLMLTLSLNSTVQAQKIECKTEKDPITGATTYKSYPSRSPSFKVEAKEGEIIKCFWPVNYAGQQHVAFKKGAEFILKLENGEIVTLKTINEPKPQTLVGSYQVVSKYDFVLGMTKEQVAKLAASPIVFSRTPTPTGEQRDDKELWQNKRLQKIYMKTFECMQGQLQ